MRKEDALASELAIWDWNTRTCRLIHFRHQEIDDRILSPEGLLLSSTDDSVVVVSRYAVTRSVLETSETIRLGFVRTLPCGFVASAKLISLDEHSMEAITDIQPCNYNGEFVFWKYDSPSSYGAYVFDERTDELAFRAGAGEVLYGHLLIWKEAWYYSSATRYYHGRGLIELRDRERKVNDSAPGYE